MSGRIICAVFVARPAGARVAPGNLFSRHGDHTLKKGGRNGPINVVNIVPTVALEIERFLFGIAYGGQFLGGCYALAFAFRLYSYAYLLP